MRVPRSICAGFPPAREWRIFAVPSGSFARSSGFSEFLHRLESGTPWQIRAGRFSSIT
ncbi:MAG: hypothetical protein OXU61_14135 [Gammaproteobacteria bacterium]|nr:hypothetical protein [Gammaproteobacteria bacterium]